jgi:hypothetical protein
MKQCLLKLFENELFKYFLGYFKKQQIELIK